MFTYLNTITIVNTTILSVGLTYFPVFSVIFVDIIIFANLLHSKYFVSSAFTVNLIINVNTAILSGDLIFVPFIVFAIMF